MRGRRIFVGFLETSVIGEDGRRAHAKPRLRLLTRLEGPLFRVTYALKQPRWATGIATELLNVTQVSQSIDQFARCGL